MARLVNENLEIPTIPEVASKALSLMDEPDVSGAQLAKIISQDQGLTAKVLKVANSSLYALPREVKNLHQASMLLGLGTLKSIVIAASCRSIYKHFGPVERSLWTHSVACAMAAHAIAQHLDLSHRDEAFVAGLMHDVGKVVMNNGATDAYSEVCRLQRERGLGSIKAELEVFGFSHPDVGSVLAQRWELTSAVEQAIFLHHDPELADGEADDHDAQMLILATHVADRLCHHLGLGSGPDQVPGGETMREDHVTRTLGLDGPQLATLVEQVRVVHEQDQASFG